MGVWRMDWILPLVVGLPWLAAPGLYLLEKRRKGGGMLAMGLISGLCLGLCGYALARALAGDALAFALDGFGGLGLQLRADGFQALYALLACGMWLVAALFSREYFARQGHSPRYVLFTLLTLGAALGVMLSGSLASLFLFFELLSLCSLPWVAQEESSQALRAAQTYLYVSLIGGFTLLMGLFLLPSGMAEAPFSTLRSLCAQVEPTALWLPCLLMLVGFGAKAGLFPLHIWLPKAHPVAPAPASALLSGLLTKAGIFGMLIITGYMLPGFGPWGAVLLWLGVITMALGALLALFSVNIKRTLACSTLSQIGFMAVGIGLCALQGQEGGLAAWGVAQHMVNHSLLKLLLFLLAGVIAIKAGSLELEALQGFGRGKPLLHILFVTGMLGLAGVPLLGGFASKSLLHEALTVYVQSLDGHWTMPWYAAAEKLFLFTGGMTLAYMLKMYLCIFWRRPAGSPPMEADQATAAPKAHKTPYMAPLTALTLCLCATCLVALGLFPDRLLTPVGRLAQGFLGLEAPAHQVHYFSRENLEGAAASLLIGLVLFAVVSLGSQLLQNRKRQSARYLNHWPAWLDLENSLYRPMLAGLVALGRLLASIANRLLEEGVRLVRKTLLREAKGLRPAPVGTHFTYGLGCMLNGAAKLINRLFRLKNPIQTDFTCSLAAGLEEFTLQSKRITRSISFGLLLFCLGLYITLAYLLL